MFELLRRKTGKTQLNEWLSFLTSNMDDQAKNNMFPKQSVQRKTAILILNQLFLFQGNHYTIWYS